MRRSTIGMMVLGVMVGWTGQAMAELVTLQEDNRAVLGEARASDGEGSRTVTDLVSPVNGQPFNGRALAVSNSPARRATARGEATQVSTLDLPSTDFFTFTADMTSSARTDTANRPGLPGSPVIGTGVSRHDVTLRSDTPLQLTLDGLAQIANNGEASIVSFSDTPSGGFNFFLGPGDPDGSERFTQSIRLPAGTHQFISRVTAQSESSDVVQQSQANLRFTLTGQLVGGGGFPGQPLGRGSSVTQLPSPAAVWPGLALLGLLGWRQRRRC